MKSPFRVRADRDALVVGMAIVPHLFSRNRMFALFTDPEVARARARAAQLRGVVRQLAESRGTAEVTEFSRGPMGVLAYRLGALRFVRRIELVDVEAACIAYLCGRAGVACITPSHDDRATVEAALRRLSEHRSLERSENPDPAPPSAGW